MSDLELPVTRYAMSGDVSIAYQTMGDGPIDLIIVPGMVSHVEFMHEGPGYTASLRRLSSFARVVTFDKRGQGLSDRMSGAPSLEQRMDLSCELRRRELVVLSLQLDDSDVGLAVIDEQVVLAHRRPARDSRDRGPQCIPSSLFQACFIVIGL